MKIPKNCQHCFYYHKEEHYCLKHNKPTGNVSSCKYWKPMIIYLQMYDIPSFEPYNQYYKGDLYWLSI